MAMMVIKRVLVSLFCRLNYLLLYFNEMLLLNLQSICFSLSDQQVVQDKDSLKTGVHAASTG